MKKKEVIVAILKARCYQEDKCVKVISYNEGQMVLPLTELEHYRTELMEEVSKETPITRINFWYEETR